MVSVLPCVVRTCAVRPFFAMVAGELGETDPSKYPTGNVANASSGVCILRLVDEAGSRGGDQNPGPQHQDS